MKTTDKKNKTIALFMGGELKPATKEHPQNPYNKPTWWGVGDRKDAGHFELQYDRSWEWLLPAYAKFRDLAKEIMYDNAGKSIPLYKVYWKEYLYNLQEAILATDLQKAFEVLANGIEWYNENKEEIKKQQNKK